MRVCVYLALVFPQIKFHSCTETKESRGEHRGLRDACKNPCCGCMRACVRVCWIKYVEL